MAPSIAEVVTEEVQAHDHESCGTIHCTATTPFGGDDPWLYMPISKQFNLSRGSQRKLVIESDEGLRNHRGFMIDPEKSALVIVDMQNYFIHPMYRDHVAGRAAVEPILKVIKRCRKERVQIIWLNWGITEKSLLRQPPAVQRGFSKSLGWHIGLGAELPDGQGRCLFKGTPNAELYPPLKAVVEPNDLFFDKDRMSGLWSTNEPLHKYLRESRTKTLLFTGVNTDQCVFGTISDAYHSGWDCVLFGDCTGTMTAGGAQELVDYNVSTNMGFVIDSNAFFIDDFLPSLSLSVSWKKDSAGLGNTIKPKKLQSQPTVTLHDESNPDGCATTNMTYVVTLTDPDAPSRDDPKWSEMCHWIAANVSLSNANLYSILPIPAIRVDQDVSVKSSPDDVVEYKPPGPPEKTGKHRYVFLVFAPRNGTSLPLQLSAPEERQHWGTGKERGGVREWADSNGLVPVAANFIYSQHKKQ
ncbi:phosphatidylethanolamine-binding protein [Lophiotrema nucula]|uniref:Phosphatidylethanolamine-binding protein n=1 Tax=Lophiotrema nucula TaxID=690887 RepID=A0A6A5YHF0_9PLEO|nr:phosphatidylethanolamine-binding protein [Lophiotrema nucula]